MDDCVRLSAYLTQEEYKGLRDKGEQEISVRVGFYIYSGVIKQVVPVRK